MPWVLRLVAVAWLVCGLAPGADSARAAGPGESQTLTRRYLPADRMVNLLEEAEHDIPLDGGEAAVDVSAFGLRTVQLTPRRVPLRHAP